MTTPTFDKSNSDWNGRILGQVLQEQPSLVLSCYSYGWLMQKRDGDAVTEFAVDPAKIAQALVPEISFDTGIMNEKTLLVRQQDIRKIVVEYRRPQKTGLFLEDTEDAIRVPFPGLIMVRKTIDNSQPHYHVYAVKKRPESLDIPLFHAPLPNVYSGGNICWGNVRQVSETALSGTSLAEDWAILLGTKFNSHGVSGKSKKHRDDVRKMYIELEQRKGRTYPKRDLLPTHKTLAQIIDGELS